MTDLPTIIKKTVECVDLNRDEISYAFEQLLSGKASPAQIAALLVALRMKGETIEEITGAALTIRKHATRINAPDGTIDTCGTGGDNSGTYNVSTAVAIVVAACGVPVAKHGNKAVSSQSGSADILTELGVNIETTIPLLEQSLHDTNLAFLFAPQFHPALKHVGPVRKELGVRTLFNLLGPLCNPAGASRQLIGVYSKSLVEPTAHVLHNLGCQKAWVVHGFGGLENGGMDELTTTGSSIICEVDHGKFNTFELLPKDAGLEPTTIDQLQGGDSKANAQALIALLEGQLGAYRDIVLLNAGAALVVANKATDIKLGVSIAAEAIDNGKAKETLTHLVAMSNS